MEQKEVYKDEDIQKELSEIYEQYHNSIKIFIGQLEVLQNKFPVEILNEIRAVFSHIAKIYVCDDKKIAVRNIEKAKGHIKRAQLDAYKYMCYAYSKYYKEFRELYKNVDLSYVNNGDFIIELSKAYASAVEKSNSAREIEAVADDSTEAYDTYEEAYYEYAKVYKLIVENMLLMEKLQQKEKLRHDEWDGKFNVLQKSNEELQEKISFLQEENEREKRKNTIITVISVGLAVVSVVLGVLTFL